MQRNENHKLTASPTELLVDFCRTTEGDALSGSVLVVCIVRRGILAPNPLNGNEQSLQHETGSVQGRLASVAHVF